MLKISLKRARRIAIYSQKLSSKRAFQGSIDGLYCLIDHLGYVQIDTISVIERAHHHIIQTRLPRYDQSWLHQLQFDQRRVFEYWGHAASFLPMKDYRFYLPKMIHHRGVKSGWINRRYQQSKHLLDPIMDRIKAEGPLGAADFDHSRKRKSNGWWDWKPAKTALEILFWRGDLMVSHRIQFKRMYDLTERVLPLSISTEYPDDSELGRFFIRRALQTHGIISEREMMQHIPLIDKSVITHSLKEMQVNSEVLAATIQGIENIVYYVDAKALEHLLSLKKPASRLSILSPFDNLIIQRDRLKRLFDFDYSLECYLPAIKRRYGYFVTPLLWNDKIVGRMDAKADRGNKILIIKNLQLEAEFKITEAFTSDFKKALTGFSIFNRCDQIRSEWVLPSWAKDVCEIEINSE